MNGVLFAFLWVGSSWMLTSVLRAFGLAWQPLYAIAGSWGVLGVWIYLNHIR